MVPNWVQNSLDNATEKQLKIYKEEWLGMPTELVEHPYLGLKNTGKWVNLLQYELFLRNSIGQSVSKPSRISPSTAVKIAESSNAHCKRTREVIVISDDSEPESIVQINRKPKMSHERPTKRHASNPDSEIIDIINSPDTNMGGMRQTSSSTKSGAHQERV